ncbi:AzlD domain-containing protein [Naumannella halotolerans]|uniref:Branched-subunit amino acid transport protein AzlD n=1 Tax=Naumannella halotolerans TaxID=993414 RepID=A0A4R7J6Q0_9ACTN|nr:AzlD domain-containing protein [Naumannella halotolerans]TDT32924.1 branched-subunit amino acid transport protein AzlD [Naumannella halotolerans]
MELMIWVLAACAVGYLIKLSGYLIPARWLDRPAVTRLAAATTIGLLASLVVVNTFADGQSLSFDARALALGAAVVALLLRAPFIIVVIAGTVAAAVGRLIGMA